MLLMLRGARHMLTCAPASNVAEMLALPAAVRVCGLETHVQRVAGEATARSGSGNAVAERRGGVGGDFVHNVAVVARRARVVCSGPPRGAG